MGRDWLSVFNTWAQPLSATEAEKCERAERMIRNAIDASTKLEARTIRVFPQGSYRNDTNVRQDSDVDICVCCTDVFVTDFTHAPGITKSQVGVVDSAYTAAQFRNEVGEALIAYFGRAGISRGDKAFDIHENTVRVDADVVAPLEHRLYYREADGTIKFHRGTNIFADSGAQIINFPDQHYNGGVAKNRTTNLAFKRVVRIVKRLRNEMTEQGVAAAKPIASFLVECLVWNTPNEHLANDTFYADVRATLVYLYNQLKDPGPADHWLEVNGIKRLFYPSQPWTREQARDFVVAAWQHIGFD